MKRTRWYLRKAGDPGGMPASGYYFMSQEQAGLFAAKLLKVYPHSGRYITEHIWVDENANSIVLWRYRHREIMVATGWGHDWQRLKNNNTIQWYRRLEPYPYKP